MSPGRHLNSIQPAVTGRSKAIYEGGPIKRSIPRQAEETDGPRLWDGSSVDMEGWIGIYKMLNYYI